MVEVAAQTALATADPAALCPLVGPARELVATTRSGSLADGMCAALEGEAARATALIDQARDRAGTGIDLLLAEKVVGAGAETRRAVDIQWEGVDEINPWRFGLASAVGVEIPARLMNRRRPADPAPGSPARRWCRSSSACGAASTAAALGVFSSHSLVEIYSLMLDRHRSGRSSRASVGARLRTAWVGRIVGEPDGGDARALARGRGADQRYARLDPHRRRGRADPALGRPYPATPTT